MIKSIFPFSFNLYWFITAYIMLILLIPFINKLLLNLNHREFVFLILILIIINDLFVWTNNNVATYRSGLGTLITPYVIGGYIRKYGLKVRKKPIYFILCLLIMYFGDIVPLVLFGLNAGERIFFGIIPLIAATLLFLMFTEIKPFYNRSINLLATTVFSSYILTEYPLIRPKLWIFLQFKNIKNTFIADLFGAIVIFLLIYIIIFSIDLLRQWIFKKIGINNIRVVNNAVNKINTFLIRK